MVKKLEFLEDQTDLASPKAAPSSVTKRSNVDSVGFHSTGQRYGNAGHQVQECGLTAATWPDQCRFGSLFDSKLRNAQAEVTPSVAEFKRFNGDHADCPGRLLGCGRIHALLFAQVDRFDLPNVLDRLDRDHRIVLIGPPVDVPPVSDRAGGGPATSVGET